MKMMTVWRSFYSGKCLHAMQSSLLAKLRKSTGYTMMNCKKALELHPSDLNKAEEWLHAEAKKQGWTKIANLQHRVAGQGIIGVCSYKNFGVMVEVNCETDFVARNIEFRTLVAQVLSSCINYTTTHSPQADFEKVYLDESHLSNLKSDTSTLGDLIATAIGKFGEKTVLRRAVCYSVKEPVILNSFAHPVTECPGIENASFGRYGGLLALRPQSLVNIDMLNDIGQKLCNHIVGMNPLSVGEFIEETAPNLEQKENLLDEKIYKLVEPTEKSSDTEMASTVNLKPSHVENEHTAQDSSDDQSSESDSEDDEIVGQRNLAEVNETRLLYQPFLFNPECTVGEIVKSCSFEIVDFQRFECGESITE